MFGYFLFMNTPEFYIHPRVIYLSPETNLQKKADFILACDAMLHARSLGESFGLSVAEFLFHGKPAVFQSFFDQVVSIILYKST